MKCVPGLRHQFVEYVPDALEDGVIYISITFATAIHRCCCGCGSEVVTPLSPTDWALTYDGETISLNPSVGNWTFPCKSHYWIERNRVIWAPQWTDRQIAESRARNLRSKVQRAQGADSSRSAIRVRRAPTPANSVTPGRLWTRLKNFLSEWD